MNQEEYQEHFDNKEYDYLIKECTKIIEENPKDHYVYYQRGMCYYEQQKYMEAFTDGVTSSRINPDQANGLKVIALSLIKMNKLQEARRVIEKGLSMEETQFWNDLYLQVQEMDTIQFNPKTMFQNWEEKLNQNKRTREYLKDESFKEYISEIIENPLLLRTGVKDPKLSECLMVLMNVDMSQFLNKDVKTNLWGEAVKKQQQESMIHQMKKDGMDVTNLEKEQQEQTPT